ncbi:bifunctional helix-turn-helix transcriptional regulator/GNAT family N-acetyltransferase [Rhizobium sp.]
MTVALTHADILSVRDASRRMVRELGFMQPTLAETDLPSSAVHAIIEIGNHGTMTANRLGKVLLLEKSTISRLLARLIERGLIEERPSGTDGRAKILSLTPAGHAALGDINRFANLRVGKALHVLTGAARQRVVGGLADYADALEAVQERRESASSAIEIHEGLLPGAIGRVAEMHGRYYAREWGMGSFFEARVASGLAEFSQRLDRPVNRVWLALQAGEIVGSIAVDGEDLGDSKAHIRWVIMDDGLRGTGTGRRLVDAAVTYCDTQKFPETHLWTFKGLDAARKLYEAAGFVLAEEWSGDQWGQQLTEQRFVRKSSA